MRRILSMTVVCMLTLALCACSTEPTLVSSAPSVSATVSETTVPAEDTIFTVGDTVALNDITVTLISVTESTGSKYNKPADGKVFVLCELEITNNSSEELTVSSMLSFEAYCDDYACDYSLSALLAKGDQNQLDGTIASGKKMHGVIGYEVPTDWTQLEIQYTLDVWSDDKIVFVATHK